MFASLLQATCELRVYFFFLFRPALTNDDFRKLLMTPKVAVPDVAPPSAVAAKLRVYVVLTKKQFNKQAH